MDQPSTSNIQPSSFTTPPPSMEEYPYPSIQEQHNSNDARDMEPERRDRLKDAMDRLHAALFLEEQEEAQNVEIKEEEVQPSMPLESNEEEIELEESYQEDEVDIEEAKLAKSSLLINEILIANGFFSREERSKCQSIKVYSRKLLVAEKLDDSQLLDIIGEVVGNEDPRDIITSKGKETKRMVVVIADLDNNNLDCVLFGDMVDHILSHLEDGKVEPLIVVLLFFKPSRWNDKVSVQSHFDVSKIHVNPDMKEVHDFWKRYKVEVMAYDETGSINMLMWDRETTQLIGRQAEQIKDEDVCSTYLPFRYQIFGFFVLFGRRRLPPTLDNMMDKKLLFKLNVKIANINKHDQVYTIMKICDDEDIVEKNCPIEFISNPSDVLTDVVEDFVTNLKCKTPTRRALNGVKHVVSLNIDNEEDFQLSTNKLSQKGGKKRQTMQTVECDN
ncbi:hypothetical protein Ahy_A03g012543 [Arachis hypogaea]|uniref:DUF223 domain-containing protein n=1 Tax=Arachis hypogaea TaxID=3818 RepID=A0A445DTM2_ARAHY|nr:hypothetical protein Ahy_A03g012543 [Arachis hypogaea]